MVFPLASTPASQPPSPPHPPSYCQACRLPYALIVDGVIRELGDMQYLLSPQARGSWERLSGLLGHEEWAARYALAGRAGMLLCSEG